MLSQRVPQERFCQEGCGAGDSRATESCWQSSSIPGTPAIACSFASFTPGPAVSLILDVIAISAPAVRRVLVVSAAPSRAEVRKLHHPRILSLLHALRQIRDSRCGVGVQWEAVSLTLRTRPGLGLAEGFTSGRLFAVFSHWQALTDYRRCHPSDIILHSFDASSRRHIDRLGRLRDHLRLVIRPSAHVAHGGPDAISSNQHYFCSSAAAREPNKPCNAFTPEPSTQALSVAVAS